MTRFTAGPWIHYHDGPSPEPNWHVVTTANKMRVLANIHIEPGNAMDLANANLIIAAPDLYEALNRLIEAHRELRLKHGYLILDTQPVQVALDALAKATPSPTVPQREGGQA